MTRPELADVTAAILAGGRGTRLRSVVRDRPKVLAPICNRPHLTYLLDQLSIAGVRTVVLLTGYKAPEVYRALGTSYRGLTLVYSSEPSPLGTGGAVKQAVWYLSSCPVLLMNGDSWSDVDLNRFLTFHRQHQADLSIVLAKQRDTARYGTLDLAPDGRVRRFLEKAHAVGPGWVNAGIYLVRRAMIADGRGDRAISLERELIPQWLSAGRRVFGFRCFGDFIDIGTPTSYRHAQRFFAGYAIPADVEPASLPKGCN
jgi:NDP-sugar pyrophosphorylase family protein